MRNREIPRREVNQLIPIRIETGEEMIAELLAVVEIDGKEFAILALPYKNGLVDIIATYVVKDAEGYDALKDIDNPTDKAKISDFVKMLLQKAN